MKQVRRQGRERPAVSGRVEALSKVKAVGSLVVICIDLDDVLLQRGSSCEVAEELDLLVRS